MQVDAESSETGSEYNNKIYIQDPSTIYKMVILLSVNLGKGDGQCGKMMCQYMVIIS